MRKRSIFLPSFLLGSAVTLLTVWILHPDFRHNFSTASEEHIGGAWSYINPLLQCENQQAQDTPNLERMRKTVEHFKDAQIKQGNITHLSLYFRDLKTGAWIGIAEQEPYRPASLAKVAIMISTLKMFEKNPAERDTLIEYREINEDRLLFIKPSETLDPAKSYSTHELVERMIKFSDNQSMYILTDHYQAYLGELKKTFDDLGISLTETTQTLSVKSYATLFRVLYNASYLSNETSEEGLRLLSSTNFDDGIVAGIPSGIKVAHKFGEYGELNSSEKQLHDCGIVYLPGNPYLVCIMTRGNDFAKLATSISAVSKLVYESAIDQSKK